MARIVLWVTTRTTPLCCAIRNREQTYCLVEEVISQCTRRSFYDFEAPDRDPLRDAPVPREVDVFEPRPNPQAHVGDPVRLW